MAIALGCGPALSEYSAYAPSEYPPLPEDAEVQTIRINDFSEARPLLEDYEVVARFVLTETTSDDLLGTAMQMARARGANTVVYIQLDALSDPVSIGARRAVSTVDEMMVWIMRQRTTNEPSPSPGLLLELDRSERP